MVLNTFMIKKKNIHKTVFYPCCGMDVYNPIELLRSQSSNFIFCDIKNYRNWNKSHIPDIQVNYLKMDAWKAITKLPQIDILFYRRDGMSEGGSGIQVLGEQYLEKLLLKFPKSGGKIITDGSNTSASYLDKLFSGSTVYVGYKLSLSLNNTYEKFGLKTFKVEKI